MRLVHFLPGKRKGYDSQNEKADVYIAHTKLGLYAQFLGVILGHGIHILK
jgi:hypothetical protein